MKGIFRNSVALVLAAIMVVAGSPAFAGQGGPSLQLDTSFNVGPLAIAVNITPPLQRPTGGFMATIHL